MYLIELFLPLFDNTGTPLPRSDFAAVRSELTERFGGLTAFTRAPAEGLWKDEEDETRHDEIVIYEVMTDRIDRDWWKDYRARLEERFGQEEIVIRASAAELL